MSGGDQNWQVGDLALCIERDWQGGPSVGSVNRVQFAGCFSTHELIARVDQPGEPGVWLGFYAFPGDGFHASCFRKIAPHTPDEEDAETIRLLTGQPATPVAPKTPELV